LWSSLDGLTVGKAVGKDSIGGQLTNSNSIGPEKISEFFDMPGYVFRVFRDGSLLRGDQSIDNILQMAAIDERAPDIGCLVTRRSLSLLIFSP
jgi:hypothetical protein